MSRLCLSLLAFALGSMTPFAQPFGDVHAAERVSGPGQPRTEAVPFFGEPTDVAGVGVLPQRLALVVGIDHYDSAGSIALPKLNYASTDAERMETALKAAGFSRVISLRTRSDSKQWYVGRSQILSALASLHNAAESTFKETGRPPVIVFYFAGHGFNMDGSDYIVPSDFHPERKEDVAEMAISQNLILDRLDWMKSALKVVILDACRSYLVQSIKSASGKEIEVVPGYRTNTQPKSPDTVIFHATLRGGVSVEEAGILPATEMLTETSGGGRLTSAIIESLKAMRSKVTNSGHGVATGIDELRSKIVGAMRREQQRQVPIMTSTAEKFVIFPARDEYIKEKAAWENFVNPLLDLKAISLTTLRERLYCNFDGFLREFTYYSYFSEAARKERSKWQVHTDCSQYAALRSQVLGASTAIKQNDGRWTGIQSAPPGAGAIASDVLKMGELVKTFSRVGGGSATNAGLKFSPTAVVDALAVINTDSFVRSGPTKQSRPKSVVEAGNFVEVKGVTPSGYLKVQTETGNEGFIYGGLVDTGKIAIREKIKFPGDNVDINPEQVKQIEHWLSGIGTALIVDMVVKYPKRDGAVGLLRAQNLVDYLLRLSSPAGAGSGPRFIPAIVSSGASKTVTPDGQRGRESDGVPQGTIEVSLMLLPFSEDVRWGTFPSVSGKTIPTAAAHEGAVPKTKFGFADVVRPFKLFR